VVTAASEEMRNTPAINSQVSKHASPSQGLRPTSTPSAVATPLPPLKRRKMVNTWPRKAASPARAASVGLKPIRDAAHTASQPFRQSPTSVKTAAPLLPLRSTLVAPGFPEPYLRGSSSPNSLLVTMAKGIEPSR